MLLLLLLLDLILSFDSESCFKLHRITLISPILMITFIFMLNFLNVIYSRYRRFVRELIL